MMGLVSLGDIREMVLPLLWEAAMSQGLSVSQERLSPEPSHWHMLESGGHLPGFPAFWDLEQRQTDSLLTKSAPRLGIELEERLEAQWHLCLVDCDLLGYLCNSERFVFVLCMLYFVLASG